MTEIVVIDVPIEQGLQQFSKYLWQQGVSHRVMENGDRRLLLVGDKQLASQVRHAYERFLAGEAESAKIEVPETAKATVVFSKLLVHLPVTLGAIILSLLGFCLVYFDRNFGLIKHFTFFDFNHLYTHITFFVPNGEYWRLITPIFLHFGLMHIAFNMTMLWFIGQRIELLQGSVRMLGISMTIGLGSNIMQAIYAEVSIFGGMSGVVYGLLGYGWVWSFMRPEKDLMIPNVILYFSLIMLVVGFAGLAGMLGAGNVANVAHLGGLIMGCLMGLGAALIDKYSAGNNQA